MPIGILWAKLALNNAPFKQGLADASAASQKWSKKVANDMQMAFYAQVSPQRWIAQTMGALRGAMAEIDRMTASAQKSQFKLDAEDIPLDAMMKMQRVAENLGAQMETMQQLWKGNTDEAKKFRAVVDQLSGGPGSSERINAARGWDILKDFALRGLGNITYALLRMGNRVPMQILELFGMRETIMEKRAARAAKQAELDQKLLEGWEKIRNNPRGSRILDSVGPIGLGSVPFIGGLLTQLSQMGGAYAKDRAVNSFSLSRPDQGSLAAIGGFTSAAGTLARTEAKNQTELLKRIEGHTRGLVNLATVEAAGGD